jgi:hypothetical protein
MLVVLSCGDDAPSSSAKPAAASAPAEDPCVAIRAEYFWREQHALLLGGAAGGGGPSDPLIRVMLNQYKLANQACFF